MSGDEFSEEILIMRCCGGDRCMAHVDKLGVCDRWAYDEENTKLMADAQVKTQKLMEKLRSPHRN